MDGSDFRLKHFKVPPWPQKVPQKWQNDYFSKKFISRGDFEIPVLRKFPWIPKAKIPPTFQFWVDLANLALLWHFLSLFWS